MNDFGDDRTGGAILLDGMPGCYNVAVMQMEAGSTNLDLAWLVWCAGILSIFQDANGSSFSLFNRLSSGFRRDPCRIRCWNSEYAGGEYVQKGTAMACQGEEHEEVLSLSELRVAQYNK